jgi:glycosyltransferase involved in cell wall biosynthesis
MGLRELGHEVQCFAPTLDRKLCYPDIIDRVGVQTFLPQLPTWFPLRDAIAMVFSSLLAPILAFRFRDVDVFVGANQPGAWIAYCMAKILRKPYVVYINQPNRLIYPRRIDQETGWLTKRDYFVLNLVIQRIRGLIGFADHRSFTSAHSMLANGQYIASVIESIYERKTVICPAGCHPQSRALLRLNPSSAFQGVFALEDCIIHKPYILITNRHEPQKKFEYAIQAFALVLRFIPDVSLVIPGPFTLHTQKLKQLARELGVGEKVHFVGQISEHQLQRLYRDAAVYCYPAPEEDFGMGVIEAMAWGVPVVAWRNAGPTVTVIDGETGFLADPFDVNDFAQAFKRLLLYPELRAEMGSAARDHVERHFTWQRHVSILEGEIYEAVGELARVRGRAPHRRLGSQASLHSASQLKVLESEIVRAEVDS